MDIDDDDPDDVLYTEDMNEGKCRVTIDLCIKLESGEINEWEIGGDE